MIKLNIVNLFSKLLEDTVKRGLDIDCIITILYCNTIAFMQLFGLYNKGI